MATGMITKRAVDATSPTQANVFLWDQEVRGFGLKVTPSGTRRYIYQYRLGGRGTKVQRITIGAHGTWTPELARKEARRLAALVDQGIDPNAEDRARKREAVELAFSAYAEHFIEKYLKSEWKGGRDLAAGILRRDAIPAFKDKSIKSITRAEVSKFLDGLADTPAKRRNTFAVLRRLFRWAINRGDLETSCFSEMEAPLGPPARDRVLSDIEVARVWLASDRMGYPFGPFIKMLILTGQRRDEVAKLDWSELDRETATWTIPAVKAKNGVVHDVHLSPTTISVLDGVAGRKVEGSIIVWPRKGLVFTTTGRTAVTGYSAAKRRLDEILAGGVARDDNASMKPWRVHDLRRTLATGLQRLGVRFEVTEAVLNHVSGSRSGIAGVYQRHSWSQEKRDALNAWAKHVIDAVGQT